VIPLLALRLSYQIALPKLLASMGRRGGVGGFIIYPVFKFENAVQLRDFSNFANFDLRVGSIVFLHR
jgi:hypothetical protein